MFLKSFLLYNLVVHILSFSISFHFLYNNRFRFQPLDSSLIESRLQYILEAEQYFFSLHLIY